MSEYFKMFGSPKYFYFILVAIFLICFSVVLGWRLNVHFGFCFYFCFIFFMFLFFFFLLFFIISSAHFNWDFRIIWFVSYPDLQWTTTALAILSRLGISTGFTIIYLNTCELYPTCVRNGALGFIAALSRFGGAVAPYIMMIVSKLIDFNGMSICRELFYAKRWGNSVSCTFVFTFLCNYSFWVSLCTFPQSSTVGWGCRMHWLHLYRGLRPQPLPTHTHQ